MKTRSAKLTDIPAIYALAVDAWSKSPFSYIELDEMKVRREIHSHIKHESQCCFVSVEGGKVVGVIGGQLSMMTMAQAYSAHSSILYGQGGSELLAAYTSWAVQNGAVLVGLDQSYGKRTEAVTRLTESHGYQYTGGQHIYIPNVTAGANLNVIAK